MVLRTGTGIIPIHSNPENIMNLLATLSNSLISLIEVITQFFTLAIPKTGRTTYNSISMVDDAVCKARRAQLIENQQELNLLLGEDEQVTESQLADINKQMDEYTL